MASANQKAGSGGATSLMTLAAGTYLTGSQHPKLALCLYGVALISAFYSLLQWRWMQRLLGLQPLTENPQADITSFSGNKINGDNSGRMITANHIGSYHEGAPISIMAAPQSPNLQITNSIECTLIQEKGVKWRQQHDGHPVLVAGVANRTESEERKAYSADNIAVRLQFYDNEGPVRYISRAFWVGHSENVLSIKIGTIKDFILGFKVDSHWVTFENERDTPIDPSVQSLEERVSGHDHFPGGISTFHRVTHVMLPKRIPTTAGLYVTATVFSEKTGQDFDKRTFYL